MKNQEKKERSSAILIMLGIIFGFLLTTFVLSMFHNDLPILCKIYETQRVNETKFLDINEVINKIHNECGSTHITKQYGSQEWSVFKQSCIAGGFCKYEYIPLKECLK